jgi:ABC-type uncharacterized transport system permease subunit
MRHRRDRRRDAGCCVKRGDKSRWALTAAIIAVAGMAVLLVLMKSAGFDVSDALSAAARGSAGSAYAIFSGTLLRATPLLIVGIAVAVAFRAGVLNIGGEGQLLAGAAAGVAVALGAPAGTPTVVLILAELVAGVAAGATWAAIPALLRFRFGVSEVVSTLLLNFVALNGVGFLVRGAMQEATGAYPQSATIPEAARLPLLIARQQLHLGFAIAIVLAIAVWLYFTRTAGGFRLAVVGESPEAAASAGQVHVAGVQARALIASGAIAGLAGIVQASGVTYILYEGLSPGYGYVAIGVALLGGLHPLRIIASAVLFGALGAGADAMQRDAGVPPEFAAVTAAIIILGLLAAPAVHRRLGQRSVEPVA